MNSNPMQGNHPPGHPHRTGLPHPAHLPPHVQDAGMMPMSQRVTMIESIATGTPHHVIRQADAARVIASLPNLAPNRHRIEKIYQNTRIETRHLAIDLLSEETIATIRNSNLQTRMQLFQDHAVPLAERVVRQALNTAAARHQTVIDDIRMIVFVTSTGFIAPGVDAELIKRLGLRRDIGRVTVNFMGCAAALNGLRIVSDHVRAHPTHKALLVCLELSSLNAVFENEMNDLIIHSIFGDGCAAVVVGSCDAEAAIGQLVIRHHMSHLVEDTEDGITLGVQDNGITCKLSRQLPDYIATGVGPAIEQFLSHYGLTKAHVDLWAVHPGGTRIIENAQRSLGLSEMQVADSWAILRQYGNMLSASVLFVLERMLSRHDPARHRPDPARHYSEPHPPEPKLLAWDHPGSERIGKVEHPWLATDSGLPPAPPPGLTGLAFSFSPGVGIEGVLFQKM